MSNIISVLIQKKISGVIHTIYPQTKAECVIWDEESTVSTVIKALQDEIATLKDEIADLKNNKLNSVEDPIVDFDNFDNINPDPDSMNSVVTKLKKQVEVLEVSKIGSEENPVIDFENFDNEVIPGDEEDEGEEDING